MGQIMKERMKQIIDQNEVQYSKGYGFKWKMNQL